MKHTASAEAKGRIEIALAIYPQTEKINVKTTNIAPISFKTKQHHPLHID